MWIAYVRTINEKMNVLNGDMIGTYEVTMSDDSNHIVVRNGGNVKVVEFYGDSIVLSSLTGDRVREFISKLERY